MMPMTFRTGGGARAFRVASAGFVLCFAFLFTAIASRPGVGAAPAASSAKPDFTGVWVIDPEKCRLDPRFKDARGTITITHKEPRFRFERVFLGVGSDERFSYELTTDGKEVITQGNGRTEYARLDWDGDVLVYSDRIVLKDGRESTDVVRYSLLDGGRTFVAEEKFRAPILKYDNLWVADRKPGS